MRYCSLFYIDACAKHSAMHTYSSCRYVFRSKQVKRTHYIYCQSATVRARERLQCHLYLVRGQHTEPAVCATSTRTSCYTYTAYRTLHAVAWYRRSSWPGCRQREPCPEQHHHTCMHILLRMYYVHVRLCVMLELDCEKTPKYIQNRILAWNYGKDRARGT